MSSAVEHGRFFHALANEINNREGRKIFSSSQKFKRSQVQNKNFCTYLENNQYSCGNRIAYNDPCLCTYHRQEVEQKDAEKEKSRQNQERRQAIIAKEQKKEQEEKRKQRERQLARQKAQQREHNVALQKERRLAQQKEKQEKAKQQQRKLMQEQEKRKMEKEKFQNLHENTNEKIKMRLEEQKKYLAQYLATHSLHVRLGGQETVTKEDYGDQTIEEKTKKFLPPLRPSDCVSAYEKFFLENKMQEPENIDLCTVCESREANAISIDCGHTACLFCLHSRADINKFECPTCQEEFKSMVQRRKVTH